MKAKLSLIAATISVLLSACGGGGGGSTSTPAGAAQTTPPVQTVPTTPSIPTSDLQTTVPASTYQSGSQELTFFNLVNDFRSKLGLGLLAQNSKLDTADQNHLKYLLTNTDVDYSAVDAATGRPKFHIEDPARPNYTGITEVDRANFTQYAGAYLGESGAYGLGQGASYAVNSLIATVYHRSGLMFQAPRDIGIAIGNDANQTVVMTFGYVSKRQSNASDYFGAYPADKQTAVPRVSYVESPNPYPDIALADFATKTSFPINVVTAENSTLVVTSFTVTEQGQSTPLDARLLTKATDPNKELAGNTAFLVGKAPFKPNTSYTVHFEGTTNGVALVKTWTFVTGS